MGENSIKTKEHVYVVVTKSLDEESERMELPTEQDHTLRLQTLIDAFPGARGLKYKNLSTGAYRTLLKNETDTKFYPPPDAEGWSNKVFIVLLPESTAQERPVSPYVFEELEKLPNNANWVTEFLFYINEGRYKSCVVALTPNYLVTFRHGTHMSYEKDSTVVRVISVNSNAEYDAKIVHICEEEDYVIMKSTENVVARECPLQECVVMKRFVVCGFGKGFPKPTFIHGTVYSNHPCVYQNNGKSFGPFVYGTAKTSLGDSGAACFGTRGLVAINLGTTKMLLTAHNEAISESAIFSPNNYMVPAYRLFEVLAKLEPKKSSKRPQHYVIDMEGYGECGI